MRPRALVVVLLSILAAASLLSCKPDPVEIRLRFPSIESFLQSESARLVVVKVAANDLGACPRLIEAAINNSLTGVLHDSGTRTVCSFRDSGETFEDVAEGPIAIVGVAIDEAQTPILAGCHIAEVYESAPTIEVQLGVTDRYRTEGVDMLSCENEEEKCQRGCR